MELERKIKVAKKKAKRSDRSTIRDGEFSTANNGLSGNRVFVSLAKTINLGNYESLKVEYGVGRTVNDGQNFDRVVKVCGEDASRSLKEMVDIVEETQK